VPVALPELSPGDQALVADSDRLLSHPALASWTARTEVTMQVAEETLRHPGWEWEVWVRRLASELFAEPRVAQVLGRRLEAMSEWLLLSGDKVRARMALLTARQMSGENAQDLPFVQALVRRDLELAVQNLRLRTESTFDLDIL